MYNTPLFWKNKNLLSTLLIPLGWIYITLSKMRTFMTKPYRAKIPVICVGNVTVGGTGKTPICMALVNDLEKQGYKNVYIVSKGYGGTLTQPTKVNKNIHTATMVGDEPLLMAERGNVVIAKSRKAGVIHTQNLSLIHI